MSETAWVTVDTARIVSIMPLAMASYYTAWMQMNPGKVGRLGEICAGVVAEFRTAIAGNPLNHLDPDVGKLPEAFVRYAEALCIGAVCQEIGHPLSDLEQSRYVRAEINLRYFYAGRVLIGGAGDGGMPSYRHKSRKAWQKRNEGRVR